MRWYFTNKMESVPFFTATDNFCYGVDFHDMTGGSSILNGENFDSIISYAKYTHASKLCVKYDIVQSAVNDEATWGGHKR